MSIQQKNLAHLTTTYKQKGKQPLRATMTEV